MTAEAANEMLRQAVFEAAEDPAFFCKFFLSEWFPEEMPPFHLGLLALITRKVSFLNKYPDCHEFLLEHFKYMSDPADPTSMELPVFQKTDDGRIRMVAGKNNNLIIPRGFSKTTLNNAVNLYEAVTDGKTFCVYISESSGHAETQLANIRHELESNNILRQAYGDVVPTRADSEKWTSGQLQLKNGAVLLARGRGSQVRGINYRSRRPNRILLDDVEDKESVSTADQRQKTLDWFYGAVTPAGNEMSGATSGKKQEPLQITILGTLLGPETLITSVARDPTFNTVKFGAILPDGQPLWEYKLNRADYDKKRSQYSRVGQLSSFALEYDSVVRVEEDAIFAKQMVQVYIPTQRSDLIQVSQALDPAISDQPGRDHTALVVAGRRASDGAIWILDEWGGLGKTPREKVDMFFEMSLRWQCDKNGIEAQQYQKALIFLMREEMARRQRFFEITPIVQGSHIRKDDRIVGILAPRYSNGYIRHRRPLPNLEQNLLDWPNGKKDFADAAAMALSLLGETAMTASPGDAITQDQYEPLAPPLPSLYGGGNVIFHETPDPYAGRYG